MNWEIHPDEGVLSGSCSIWKRSSSRGFQIAKPFDDPERSRSLEAFYLESSRSRGFDLDHLGNFYLEGFKLLGFDLNHLGNFYLEGSRPCGFDLSFFLGRFYQERSRSFQIMRVRSRSVG
jgi:hypothetical protein